MLYLDPEVVALVRRTTHSNTKEISMTDTPTPASERKLHDNCPACGFRFPRPQARCKSTSACEKRQTKRDAPEEAAKPAAEAVDDVILDRPSELTDEEKAHLATIEQALADAPAPLRVKLNTGPQGALVDELFKWKRGDDQGTGRRGAWLVVQIDDVEHVRATLFAAANGELGLDARKIQTAGAIYNRFQQAVEARADVEDEDQA